MANVVELNTLIGDRLSSSTGVTQYTNSRIYFKFLPDNFRKTDIQLTYVAKARESFSNFDDYDYSEDYDLDINIVYKSSKTLYLLVPEIKDVIIPLRTDNVRFTEFTDDDLIWNSKAGVYNLLLRFKIVWDR